MTNWDDKRKIIKSFDDGVIHGFLEGFFAGILFVMFVYILGFFI